MPPPTESVMTGTMTGWPEQSLQWCANATFDPRSSRYCDVKDNPWEPFIDSAQTMTATYGPNAGPVQGFGSSTNNTGASSQNIVATGAGTYFMDPDGVVRRAMGGYNTYNSTGSPTLGLPMAPAPPPPGVIYNSSTTPTPSSRPIMLHRPFRSVAELGYVFSDRPWKNLDFFSPESGDGRCSIPSASTRIIVLTR